MKEEIIQQVHRLVNKKLSEEYPGLGMARHPEGSIKKWEVEFVLRTYEEVKKKK